MKILTDQDLNNAGIQVKHHYSDREYAKECFIPAGTVLEQHDHPYSHLSVLGRGRALVEVGGIKTEYQGPCCITIDAGVIHTVTAITDVDWYCIHAVQDKDPNTVDATILSKEQ
jgi:quercetin dioxygenase-like cupin family protein